MRIITDFRFGDSIDNANGTGLLASAEVGGVNITSSLAQDQDRVWWTLSATSNTAWVSLIIGILVLLGLIIGVAILYRRKLSEFSVSLIHRLRGLYGQGQHTEVPNDEEASQAVVPSSPRSMVPYPDNNDLESSSSTS